MSNTRRLVVSVLGTVLLAAPLIGSQDIQTSKAKVIVTQPLAIQELGLQPQQLSQSLAPTGSRFRRLPWAHRIFPVTGVSSLERHCRQLQNRRAWTCLRRS